MKHFKKWWKTYLTLINTFMCVLLFCWYFVGNPKPQWESVYLVKTPGRTYCVEWGYENLQIKKEGERFIIRWVSNGEQRTSTYWRDQIDYVDYL